MTIEEIKRRTTARDCGCRASLDLTLRPEGTLWHHRRMKQFLFEVVTVSPDGRRSFPQIDAGPDHYTVAARFRADEDVGVEVVGPVGLRGVLPVEAYFPPEPMLHWW
jgi:hypothetical protein